MGPAFPHQGHSPLLTPGVHYHLFGKVTSPFSVRVAQGGRAFPNSSLLHGWPVRECTPPGHCDWSGMNISPSLSSETQPGDFSWDPEAR